MTENITWSRAAARTARIPGLPSPVRARAFLWLRAPGLDASDVLNGAFNPQRLERTPLWQQILAAVAAAAGGAAWVSAVGSGILAMRLREAQLPVEPVVALMSNEHRFAVGTGYLLTPLLAGLVGLLVDVAYAAPPAKVPKKGRIAIAAITLTLGFVVIAGLIRLPWGQALVQGVALVGTVVAAFAFFEGRVVKHRLHEHLIVFLAVLVVSGLTALLVERFRHSDFSSATVVLSEPARTVRGGYVTSTEHAVLVVTRLGRCARIIAIPRGLITEVQVGPSTVRPAGCPATARAVKPL